MWVGRCSFQQNKSILLCEEFGHPHHRQTQICAHWSFVSFGDRVTQRSVERFARKCRHQLCCLKTGFKCRVFARYQNASSNSTTRPRWMNKERPNARRVAFWVKLFIFTDSFAVAA